MSDKLRKQLDVERQQLNRLIDEHRTLLDRCAATEPNAIEVSALATFLHSFYSGIENSLKRVAAEIDHSVPKMFEAEVDLFIDSVSPHSPPP